MEDISRELEKEIEAYSSPVRIKRKKETRLIAVNDFGEMRSADWVKKFILFLLSLSLILIITTFLFYRLYSSYRAESLSLRKNLEASEKKVKDAVREKEYLMAKLVISNSSDTASPGKVSDNKKKTEKLKEVKKEHNNKVIGSKVAKIEKKVVKPASKKVLPEPVKNMPAAAPEMAVVKPSRVSAPDAEPGSDNTTDNTIEVGIERFMIVKDKASRDLFVKFRVLNKASEKGDASGRVFVVLSSNDGFGAKQLVVPKVPLKENLPTIPRRGQYFAITHFKPVKFRIRNVSNPELYNKAIVLIFARDNKLILNKEINISIGG